MPICIECGETVPSLYIEYGRGNIKLLQCDKCKKFADKYLEYDYIIIFIDMLLHKRSVYRHLVFNRLEYTPYGYNDHLLRLGVLLVLFEVYMKWFRLDRMEKAVAPDHVSLPLQYVYILMICAVETIVLHVGSRAAARWVAPSMTSTIESLNQLSMCLILSSFGKILLIVMVIWDYGSLDPSILVNALVFTSNMEAVSVFLGPCGGVVKTFGVLSAGIVSKIGAQLCVWYMDPNIELTWI